MSEFNERMSEVGLPGFVMIKDKLSLFRDVDCRTVVGKGSVINDLIKVMPGIIDGATIYSDDTCQIKGHVNLSVTKGNKFPIDFAATFEGYGYLIVKGKTVFGAISEAEGSALAKRIIANIMRNYS